LIGRLWDQQQLDEMSSLLGIPVRVVRDGDIETTLNRGAGQARTRSLYRTLSGWDGKPVALLEAATAWAPLQDLIRAWNLRFVVGLAVVLTILALTYRGLTRWLLAPLSSISASLATENPTLIEGFQEEKTEFGHIARLIAAFFEQRTALVAEVQERERAEHTLRESEAQFRTLFETIPGAVFVHSGERFLDVNAAMERITGYTRDELLDMPFWELVHPDFRGLIKDRGQARLRGKATPSPYETKIVTKDGEERRVIAAASRVGSEGEPTVLGTLIDITDLKEAQAAGERQRQLLVTLMEAMPDYIYVKDAESRFLLNNQAHLLLLGAATQEEVAGKTDADVFSPELATKYRDDEQAVLVSGQPLLNREERTEDPEGKEQWLLTTKVPFRDSDGHVIGIVGISRDITARKRAEEEIRALSRFRERIIENANVWLDVLDERANVVIWNRAAEEISGFSREEVVGHEEIWEWLYPDEAYRSEIFRKAMATIENGEVIEGLETTIRAKGGEEKIIAWDSRNLADDRGKQIGSVALGRDVTARKRAEAELREAKEFAESLIGSMLDGVAVLDSRGVHIDANSAFCQMTGFSREELIGVGPPHPYWPPEGSEEIETAFQKTLRGDFVDVELTFMRKNGERFPVIVSPSCIRDRDGNVVSYFATVKDMTERKRSEEALLAYQEQLRRLASELSMAEQRERQRLAAYLHDDIVQGLALGKIKLGELQAAAPPGLVQDLAESVRGVISRLIEDARSMTMELNPPVLHQLGLAAAIEDLVETMQEGNPVLFTFADDGKPKPLDEDILLTLYRSVREVLINAVKHAQARHIRVSKRRCEDWVEVVVEDDGVGMNVSEIDERKPRSAARKPCARPGGFGLFSVRERIQFAGGQFALESEPGRGTRVVLKAPLKRTS